MFPIPSIAILLTEKLRGEKRAEEMAACTNCQAADHSTRAQARGAIHAQARRPIVFTVLSTVG